MMAIMLPHVTETINVPTDRESYRIWLRGIGESARRILFGVRRDANIFRCPTNGRHYESTTPPVLHDDPVTPFLSTSCYWCDTHGRVRGEVGFDRGAPQPHSYVIVEEVGHAAD